jgi:hypothetical protein
MCICAITIQNITIFSNKLGLSLSTQEFAQMEKEYTLEDHLNIYDRELNENILLCII